MRPNFRIAFVEKQDRNTEFWICNVCEGPDSGKRIHILPSEFDYSPVGIGDMVELTYCTSPAGFAGWTAHKLPPKS